MAVISNPIKMDEKTWQGLFYDNLFGEDYDGISIDRSTDGYTRGILFEHKTNIQSYGESKALGQALIYLTRFNRDGVPVPAKICLVGQEEQKCYIYDTANYLQYINNIPKYANLKASDGIPGFSAAGRTELIPFDMSSAAGMHKIYAFVQQAPQNVKVDINVHNVYGWANFYYDHAAEYKQKPEKKKFFDELRNPKGTLEAFINPWTGKETDFKYIMDILNDPETQKKLGAFYTPAPYSKKASELVKKAIERVPEGNDYVIIDRCGGTGNLEMYFDDKDDDILSHVILSTYELKEWIVLKDRYEGRVRYIIPPVPANEDEMPELNKAGFLCGANALTREIIDNPEIRKHLDNPKCTIILYENPPYIETTGIEFQKQGKSKKASAWKKSYVVEEMKKEIKGTASNDMGNAFIWSAFKYFLRQPTDSYVVFSPVKYWKSQHLINKKFMGGYGFNRRHFHTKIDACVMVAYWSNEESKETLFNIRGFNLDEKGNYIDCGDLSVRRISGIASDFYDNRAFPDDTEDGIVVSLNGEELQKGKPYRVKTLYNDNIVGYMVVMQAGFDNPDLNSGLTVAGRYDGNGFFLRKDNWLSKLPIFVASRYCKYNREWTERARIMKTSDKKVQFEHDFSTGVIDKFIKCCLIFTGFEPQNHCRSLNGSDGRFYKNELCFDNLDGKTTLARQKLNEFIADGYELSDEEKALFEKWDSILEKAKETDEYNPGFIYGLYQIDEEINIKIQQGFTNDGKPKMVWKYGDLNNLIKDLKAMVKSYYLNNLVDTLFEYEFLK